MSTEDREPIDQEASNDDASAKSLKKIRGHRRNPKATLKQFARAAVASTLALSAVSSDTVVHEAPTGRQLYDILPTKGTSREAPLSLSLGKLGLAGDEKRVSGEKSVTILKIIRDPVTGKLAFEDTSPHGVPESTLEWMGKALGSVEPILAIASQGPDLKTIEVTVS